MKEGKELVGMISALTGIKKEDLLKSEKEFAKDMIDSLMDIESLFDGMSKKPVTFSKAEKKCKCKEQSFDDILTKKVAHNIIMVRKDGVDVEKQIILSIPGIKKENISIKTKENKLQVKATLGKINYEDIDDDNEEQSDIAIGFVIQDIEEYFTLESNIDEKKVKFSYNDGVLAIYLPIKQAKEYIAKEIN